MYTNNAVAQDAEFLINLIELIKKTHRTQQEGIELEKKLLENNDVLTVYNSKNISRDIDTFKNISIHDLEIYIEYLKEKTLEKDTGASKALNEKIKAAGLTPVPDTTVVATEEKPKSPRGEVSAVHEERRHSHHHSKHDDDDGYTSADDESKKKHHHKHHRHKDSRGGDSASTTPQPSPRGDKSSGVPAAVSPALLFEPEDPRLAETPVGDIPDDVAAAIDASSASSSSVTQKPQATTAMNNGSWCNNIFSVQNMGIAVVGMALLLKALEMYMRSDSVNNGVRLP